MSYGWLCVEQTGVVLTPTVFPGGLTVDVLNDLC